MTLKRVKWGILGTASIARRRFMPGMQISNEAEVVAIASREERKARDFAAQFGIEKAYGSYDDLLSDPEIEAVYLPLPSNLHAEWTKRSAAAGKHILCEKPLSINAESCREMIDACRNAGVLLMEGFMYRHHPRTKMIKQLISDGSLGDPLIIHSTNGYRLTAENDIRLLPGEGAGCLLDAGCYSVNIARYLFGEEPVRVFASARLSDISGSDLTLSALMEFPGGRVSLFDCSFEASYKQMMQVSGTGGTMIIDKPFVPGPGQTELEVIRQDSEPLKFTVEGYDQFALEIDHFSRCVRTGEKPELDPEDAVGNLRVMDALRESVRTRRSVDL